MIQGYIGRGKQERGKHLYLLSADEANLLHPQIKLHSLEMPKNPEKSREGHTRPVKSRIQIAQPPGHWSVTKRELSQRAELLHVSKSHRKGTKSTELSRSHIVIFRTSAQYMVPGISRGQSLRNLKLNTLGTPQKPACSILIYILMFPILFLPLGLQGENFFTWFPSPQSGLKGTILSS